MGVWVAKPPAGWPIDPAAVTAYGFVALWALLEGTGTTIADSVGTNTGTMNGALSWSGTDVIGFAGGSTTTTYIDCGNASVINPLSEVTYGGWFYPTLVSPAGWWLARDDNSLGRSYACSIPGSNGPGMQIQGSNIFTGGTQTITTNAWNLLALSGSTSGGWISYVNGVQSGTATWSAPATATGATCIGRRTYASNQNGFFGRCRMAWICNKVMTPTQHAALNTNTWQVFTPSVSIFSRRTLCDRVGSRGSM